MKRNPVVKVGDKLLVKKCNNGQSITGKIVTILVARTQTGNNIKVVVNGDITGKQHNLFYSGPADEFIFADKKALITSIKVSIKENKKELKELQEELEFQEKYDSEEDYLAHKLEKILSANDKGTTTKSRVDGIKEVLLTLKGSNLL